MSNWPTRARSLALLLAVTAAAISLSAATWQQPSADRTASVVAAADAFLATLDPPRRAKANPALDAKTRTIWSNLPSGTTMQVGATERNGLKLSDMSPAQEKAALALLATTLSRDGYEKVMRIVDADQVLETRSAPTRQPTARIRFGRGEFYLAVLGRPSARDKWMLQFGGHHLAINVTFAGTRQVLAPTHTGAQPASYTVEGRTVRPLGRENDKAFALITAFPEERRTQAVLRYEVMNLVLGPGTDGKTIEPEGVRASTFTASERAMLLDLVREWVDILGSEPAAAKMKEIESNLAETWFAWAGPTTNGKGAYFRIQGPTVFIEYAPQGAGDTNVDHIHTIYRDPTNDYADRVTP
jgi:hypothetical protein